jgi:predicted nucleic acid-binding protein
MKIFFLDTNILIDFLAERQPFAIEAARLLSLAVSQKIKIVVSAASFNNIYYILRKQQYTHQQTIKLLTELFSITETVDVTKDIIQNSLRSGFKDFEDSIQYFCAAGIKGIDGLVTRDPKDYTASRLPVLSPAAALQII